jgi:hypothetical protein
MMADEITQLRAELARVRLERDRLAQWVYHPDGPDAADVIDLMTDGPGPVSEMAAALAEHDAQHTPGPTPPRA